MADLQSHSCSPASMGISFVRCPGVPTTSHLAHQLGYFAGGEPGVDGISLKLDCVPRTVMEEPYWLRHSSYVNAIADRAAGADSKVIAMSWLEGRYPIFTRRDQGIFDLAELRGRRIGVLRSHSVPFDVWRSQNLTTYSSALSLAGLSLADVEVAYVDRSHALSDVARDLVQALIRGEVDAIAASVPPEVAGFLNLHQIYDSHLQPDHFMRANPSVLRCLVVSGHLLREHRPLVVDIVSRLMRAAEWARIHPVEAVELLARDLNKSKEALLAIYEDLERGVQLSANQELVDGLQHQKGFLLAQDLIQGDFDVASWVDTSILADARTLVHGEPVRVAS